MIRFSGRGPAALLLLLAIGLAACGPSTSAPAGAPAASAPKPAAAATAPAPAAPAHATVRLGIVSGSSDVAFFIAMDKGYFAEQALDVDAQTFRSAAEMTAPLGAGQLEVGGGNPSPGLLNAIGRGIPLRIVADKGRQSPGNSYEGLVLRKELVESGRFRDLADLRGMAIGVSAQGSSGEIVLDGALKQVGLSTRDLNMTVMGFPDMPAALVGGSLDGAMLIEPFLVSAVERDIGVLWKRTDEISPNFQAAVVLYGPAILDQPDVAQRFMVGYVKATRFYHQALASKGSPAWQEVVDTLIKNTGVKDRPIYDRMVLPGLDADALVNVETLRLSQDWWVDRGLQTEKIDLDRAVDLSYVRAAAAQLGPASR
jgi:NitT/TauT family transport system substrate-binding protein